MGLLLLSRTNGSTDVGGLRKDSRKRQSQWCRDAVGEKLVLTSKKLFQPCQNPAQNHCGYRPSTSQLRALASAMIPHIIHQTWKTKEIPQRFLYFRDSWLKHHPDWEYRLWSDADNRAFLAANYPDFLPVYDGYESPICRADAIRYFLLKHFGGLYVDLDFECLQPLDDVLNSPRVILGFEPVAHVLDHAKTRPGLTRIVCNALMASPPAHPFWDHVIQQMEAARGEPDPLDATGPFLLTRAVDSYKEADAVQVTPASVFYPVDVRDGSEGRLFDLENWQRVTAGAYAAHHWAGSWYRDPVEAPQHPSTSVRLVLAEGGKIIAESMLHARQCAAFNRTAPLISCLMVTRNRSEMACGAVNGFLTQTYPVRELIILDDSQDLELEIFLRALADPNIRYLRLQDEGATLGALRNQAVALARGSYICQWDDDDLYDPARLAMQMTAMVAMKADACFLSRWLIWWPKRERLAVSSHRVWEGSMLCLKSSVPLYQTIGRGEDTPVADQIAQSGRVVLLDQARLYVYVVHEGNTFGSDHFESQWLAASEQFSGVAYERMMQELRKRLDLEAYLAALDNKANAAPPKFASDSASSAPDCTNRFLQNAAPNTRSAKTPSISATTMAASQVRVHDAGLPGVLILTPIKNASQFVPGYFELAARLDYPRGKLTLAFLEGDSDDGTYELLQDHAHRHRADFASIDLYQHDFALQLEGERWAQDKQFVRRSVIAKCRNMLFKLSDRGANRILWIDADVIDYPTDILRRLLEVNKPITVPNCVQIPGGASFDLNSFKFKSGTQNVAWAYTADGIIQPPRGSGRLYLEDFRGTEMVELDGVGGTMLLVDAALHRHGIMFPDYSYRGYLDTEGFAMQAKDHGISCWGVPDLEIVHASQ